jgi:hypothetical protein
VTGLNRKAGAQGTAVQQGALKGFIVITLPEVVNAGAFGEIGVSPLRCCIHGVEGK